MIAGPFDFALIDDRLVVTSVCGHVHSLTAEELEDLRRLLERPLHE